MRKLANAELDRKNIDEFKEAQKTPIIVILDDIRSLHNIGSVFRTSDAFLIEKIFFLRQCWHCFGLQETKAASADERPNLHFKLGAN